jgi:hypothetical protein
MLPDVSSMAFDVNPVLNAQDDVMISNRGIVFPALPAAPALNDMFAAIAEGRAGNPVFTDSRRPDGDE